MPQVHFLGGKCGVPWLIPGMDGLGLGVQMIRNRARGPLGASSYLGWDEVEASCANPEELRYTGLEASK